MEYGLRAQKNLIIMCINLKRFGTRLVSNAEGLADGEHLIERVT